MKLNFVIQTLFAKSSTKAPEKQVIYEQNLCQCFKDGFLQNMNVCTRVCVCVCLNSNKQIPETSLI